MVLGLNVGSSAVVVALTSVAIYYLAKFIRVYLLISKFGGPPALPIIGNTHQFGGDAREFFLNRLAEMNEYRARHGGLLRRWLGPMPSLIIYGAKHVEVILKSSRHTNKSFIYTLVRPWLGLGLLISTGKKWFHRRKMLTPTFHFSILQNFIDVFNKESAILAEKLSDFADKPDPVNVFPLVTYCTLDIICATAMGKHINAQGDNDSEYVRAIQATGELIMKRFKTPYLWPDWLFYRTKSGVKMRECLKILHGTTRGMIHERLNQSTNNDDNIDAGDDGVTGKRKRIAFLDLLLKMHREDPRFTLDDIQEEVDTFMFAGHDTTSVAICWALLMIGLNPGIQERLHDEIDQVFGDSDRPVTTDDLANLPYLTNVVKETLRMLPSAPIIGRKLDEDIILDGKVVPKETDIGVAIYSLHHDPEQFPDPERFDPDRFLPENNAKRHPYAYVPFSAGPRNCIGQKFALMEDKVVLTNLLRRFSFQSAQTIDEAKPAGELILRPSEGKILVRITKRAK